MTHGSLFSGIGGFDLAASWCGWQNIFHCEINPFGQRVLKYHFPDSILYEDIKSTDFTVHRGQIDVLSGGFPCQPYSLAGQRKGKEDERHLWPEMLRAIREIAPRWVVGENVHGIISWSGGLVFDEVQTDLEAQGYEVWTVVLPACAKDAPHRRDRVWFIAYSSNAGSKSMRSGWQNSIYTSESFTDSDGLIGRSENGQFSGKQKQRRHLSQIQETIPGRNATDPPIIGLQRGFTTEDTGSFKRQLGRSDRINSIPEWRYFPTQSPICDRNDGIPDRLVGITFPKWRQESIMAMGNAVVPQVVYEIFKIIPIIHNS